uniref:Uncharacterized protein n=1 Tax=Lepeophtheirus salmonis TaxID=72036 RepID=A0A0K2TXD6_LEPSM
MKHNCKDKGEKILLLCLKSNGQSFKKRMKGESNQEHERSYDRKIPNLIFIFSFYRLIFIVFKWYYLMQMAILVGVNDLLNDEYKEKSN